VAAGRLFGRPNPVAAADAVLAFRRLDLRVSGSNAVG
jgi:hypothetical protein